MDAGERGEEPPPDTSTTTFLPSWNTKERLDGLEAIATAQGFDIPAAEKQLREKGWVILRGVYSPEQVAAFTKAYDESWEDAKAALRRTEATRYWEPEGDNGSGTCTPSSAASEDGAECETSGRGPDGLQSNGCQPCCSCETTVSSPARFTYMLKDWTNRRTLDLTEMCDLTNNDPAKGAPGRSSVLVKTGPGRYELCHRMQDGVFAGPEYHEPPALGALMRRMLQEDYTHYNMALISEQKNPNGAWHRDSYDLWGESKGDVWIDGTLPPFYFTTLAPLGRMDERNGATEIISGSHHLAAAAVQRGILAHGGREPFLAHEDSVQMCADAGDIVVFDGRAYHRGLANDSDEPRRVLCQVWHKMWYSDYATRERDFPWGTPVMRHQEFVRDDS